MIGAHELDKRLAVFATRPGKYTAFVAQGAFRRAGRQARRRIPRGRIGMPGRVKMPISGAPPGGSMRMAMEFEPGQKTEQHGQEAERHGQNVEQHGLTP
jgi:hypothetical protein